MNFLLFNKSKKINIPDTYIKMYEENVAPFNEKRAEYLAVTSNLTHNNTEEEIEAGIIKGIQEEVDAYIHKDFIIQKAKDTGLIE